MPVTPMNAVEALSYLLQDWFDVAFSEQDRPVLRLHRMWRELAAALCGTQKEKYAVFQRELNQSRVSSKAGNPPIHALEQRLHELTQTGLDEVFLVIAVRQSIDHLIRLHFPTLLDDWTKRAESVLPCSAQFGQTGGATPLSRHTYEPNEFT